MDTKQVIGVSVLGALVLALIIGMFVADASNTTTLKVGNKEFDVSDFKSYVKVWNYEDDASKDDLNTMFTNFQSYKVYSTRAEKAGVELSEDEKVAELTSGDYATLLADYDLTSGEYMRVKTEIALANKLYASPYEFAKISKDYYDNYKTAMIQTNGKEVFDTYDYRVIEVLLPQDVEVEDDSEVVGESGETTTENAISGESSGDKAAKEQQKKDETKKKAEALRNLVVEYVGNPSGERSEYIARLKDLLEVTEGDEDFSGDVFDYIGKFEESPRYISNSNGIMSVANGELTSASKLYFAEDMTGDSSYLKLFGYGDDAKNIVDNVTSLKEGEVSEIFESLNGYSFVYLEKVRNELDEADNTRFLNEIANEYIGQNANMTFNKAPINNLKLEDLIPKIAREKANNSGDVVASGENVETPEATSTETPAVSIEPVTSGEEVNE